MFYRTWKTLLFFHSQTLSFLLAFPFCYLMYFLAINTFCVYNNISLILIFLFFHTNDFHILIIDSKLSAKFQLSFYPPIRMYNPHTLYLSILPVKLLSSSHLPLFHVTQFLFAQTLWTKGFGFLFGVQLSPFFSLSSHLFQLPLNMFFQL